MKNYLVGGAVRDALLGRAIHDHDYVVVGASPEEMLNLRFKPVGKDFPVFLHPVTGDEYALARTERKTGPGYAGFAVSAAPDVTLEADLARRDLTINAMARGTDGNLFDPYGGQRDLAARVLRHIGPAFAEDPVRILRLARFASRFPDFSVAPETMALMRRMVQAGDVDALVPERVWAEISRGLMDPMPSRMINVLRECGALARLLPEVNCLFGVPQPEMHHPEIDTGVHINLVIDHAAQQGFSLPARVACLLHDVGKGLTAPERWPAHHGHEEAGVALVLAVCDRLRVATECRDLAVMMARHHTKMHQVDVLRVATVVSVMRIVDAFRRPERFEELLRACACDSRGRKAMSDKAYPQQATFLRALAAAKSVDVGAIVRARGTCS